MQVKFIFKLFRNVYLLGVGHIMNVIQSLLLTKIQLFMLENTVKQQILFYHFTALVIQPIYVNNGTEGQTKTYKADFFTNTLDMIP